MSELKDKQYHNSSNYRARIHLHYKFGSNKYSWPLWVFSIISNSESAKVLEIGCGNGLLWKYNSGRIPRKWDITLSDFSEGMLKDAEKNIGGISNNVRYRVIDAENIPYDDNSFDIILANHMLYHVNDRGKVLSEIRRVLKEDGIFYATTMEKDYMKELTDIVREYRSVPDGDNRSNGVIKNFSLQNGEEQLKEYFGKVELKIYENVLEVTEAAPFTEYAVSLNDITPGKTVLHVNEKEKFTDFVQAKIDRYGSINFSANAGIFICRNI